MGEAVWVRKMTTTEDTRARIVTAALSRYMLYGIKKTSMEDVAAEAGLTRVTIYRYYPDKKNLVRAAFMYLVDILNQVHNAVAEKPDMDMEMILERLLAAFETLPRGELRLVQHELGRLHPDIWRSYIQMRTEALDKIFEPLFAKAERRGVLRPGVNRQAFQAFLMNALIDTLQEPAAMRLKISEEEILATVHALFLHGALRDRR
jgi:AcrR family transcriptional regulator